jgi:hypothetical protein
VPLAAYRLLLMQILGYLQTQACQADALEVIKEGIEVAKLQK